MNKTITIGIFFLIAVSLLAASSAIADVSGKGEILAGKHIEAGITCADCHTSAPTKLDACLSCHDGYEGMAESTAKLTPNPHGSHMGKVKCMDCHKLHSVPVKNDNRCEKACHTFGFKIP